MKVKKYKIFEQYGSDAADELIEEFDDNYIEKFFDDNYSISFHEAIELYGSSIIKNHINDEEYAQSWIDSEIESRTFEDYSDWDFKNYIKQHLTTAKEQKALELYNENNYNENEEDDEKTTEYSDDLLDDLDNEQLIEVIESDDDEYDFKKSIAEDTYLGRSALDIIYDIYGDLEEQEKKSTYNRYGYGKKPHTLYDEVKDYIDEEAVVEDIKNNEDFEYKKEYLKDRIYDSKKSQRRLLKINKKNSLKLAELFEETSGSNIGNEYKFQKAYIKSYTKEENVFDKTDEEYEKEKRELIATALEYLYNNFELNTIIEKLYPNEMYKINIKKYNI
jgi:hypothetical protein